MNRFWHLLWIFSVAVMILQLLIFFPDLPETVPTHFDFAGQPDNYSSKASFLTLWIILIISINIWFPLIGLLIRKLPKSLVNIPNKYYWYSTPDRIEKMTGITKTMLAMLFSLINLMFIYIFHHTYEISMHGESTLPMWVIFIPIMLVMILPIIYLYKNLRIPETDKTTFQAGQ